MTEAEFTGEVLALALQLGLLVHWCRDSRRCEGSPGLPDLILAGRRGVLFAEIKMPWGDTSPDQDNWLWHLNQAGIEWEVWGPSDMQAGVIRRKMEALA